MLTSSPSLAESSSQKLDTVHEAETFAVHLSAKGVHSTTVEAGHVYLDDSIDDPSIRQSLQIQFAVGSAVSHALNKQSIQVQKLLFVDDYNAKESTLDLSAYTNCARDNDFSPDAVLYESQLVPLATYMCHQLEQCAQTIWKNREDYMQLLLGKKHKSLGRVELLRVLPAQPPKMSCTSLDAALTLYKWTQGNVAINVLPAGDHHHNYFKQQQRVHHVLSAFQSSPDTALYSLHVDEDSLNVFPPLS